MTQETKTAKSEEEWYKLVREDWNAWEAKCHPEDSFDFNEWLSEQTGYETYGYTANYNYNTGRIELTKGSVKKKRSY